MKKIFLTFDYELFFGKSGTPEQCLLVPTEKILTVLGRQNIKATFFVDILYYLRLLDYNGATQEIAQRIREQLVKIVYLGHRIELHLHPHWHDAEYRAPEWGFADMRHFRLHSLNQRQITQLFIDGVSTLQGIANEADSEYRVTAFRAGGWCIQPFGPLRDAFISTNISIDSSVGYGIKGASATHAFDFTHMPKESLYKFSTDPLINDPRGEFIELPITTYDRSKSEAIIKRLLIIARRTKYFGDGKPLPLSTSNHGTKLNKLLKADKRFLSIEGTPYFFLDYFLSTTPSQHIVTISHPKMMSDYDILTLDKLTQSSDKYSFHTVHEASFLIPIS